MSFKILKQSKKSLARAGEIKTAHGQVKTPVFMPCATAGAVKGVSFEELKKIGYELILANTYHLYLRPGEKYIKKMGGLQKFINWHQPILTDSGGYQIFSLARNKSLVKIEEKGVWFKSHLDGSSHFISPEKAIDIQLALGSDIIMPLDLCPSAEAEKEEIARAVDLTNRWFERAWQHFQQKTKNLPSKPALFAIVQGGADKNLRRKSAEFLRKFPVDGFAIGGVANAGESKTKQRRAVEYVLPYLPPEKPRYLMGVGEPEDLIFAVQKGIDLFDCVLPTRLARHGTVFKTKDWQKFQKIDLKKSANLQENEVIMKNCQCPACAGNYSRAYISYLIREKEMLGLRLASLHNLYLYFQLMYNLRRDIL